MGIIIITILTQWIVRFGIRVSLMKSPISYHWNRESKNYMRSAVRWLEGIIIVRYKCNRSYLSNSNRSCLEERCWVNSRKISSCRVRIRRWCWILRNYSPYQFLLQVKNRMCPRSHNSRTKSRNSFRSSSSNSNNRCISRYRHQWSQFTKRLHSVGMMGIIATVNSNRIIKWIAMVKTIIGRII